MVVKIYVVCVNVRVIIIVSMADLGSVSIFVYNNYYWVSVQYVAQVCRSIFPS